MKTTPISVFGTQKLYLTPKKTKNMADKKIIAEDWFKQLKEEIQSIHTESIFISRIELLRGKWLIGEAIESKVGDFKRSDIYGERINDLLAEGLGVSARELQRCRLFYRKFQFKNWDDTLEKLPEGKNISWNKVLGLIGKTRESGGDEIIPECIHDRMLIKCLDCKRIFTIEEFLQEHSK